MDMSRLRPNVPLKRKGQIRVNPILPDNLLSALATTGIVVAGVALFEVALVPGIAIGAAAVLTPKLLARLQRSRTTAAAQPQSQADAEAAKRPEALPERTGPFNFDLSALTHLRLSRSVAKTITFRVIVTGIEFTAHYLILGDPVTAIGLSAFSLVIGPGAYFLHEALWNYLRATDKAAWLPRTALAKTITFRTFASIAEFSVNYAVVQDMPMALLLSSFGFFLGPFVYYGHEMAWDRFAPEKPKDAEDKRWPDRRVPVIIDVEPVPAAG